MDNISFNSQGKNLEAKIWLPENSKKAIIVAHSFRNNMDEPACIEAAQEFAENAYAVLSFNFLGHGNSEGTLRDVSYKSVGANIASAIEFLKAKNFSQIGIYAISIGAIASVLSQTPTNAQVFLNPSPLYNPRGLLERYSKYINDDSLNKQGYAKVLSGSGRGSFEMGKEWIREMQKNPKNIHHKYQSDNIPTLILQGTQDDLSPLKTTRKFIQTHSPSNTEYQEIENADHNFTNLSHRKEAIKQALDFFQTNL
jgi:esterase/lipase